MSAWRSVGLNYITYSNIAAKVVRQALKSQFRNEAKKREDTFIKFTPWADGKPLRDKTF